jgi:prolyl-tRNA editing enzyme YbaK/EbsC (Cys-tRNA(Pro) deacylase)
MPTEHPSIVRVRAELTARGGAGDQVRILDGSARTAAEAAAQLGVDEAPLLVLASGRHQVDTAKVAALVGATSVRRPDADFVRTHTGFAIGGVAPLGHPEQIRTLVDRDLAQYDVLWAAAGHPQAVFPTTYDELVTLTGGEPADVGV